MPQASFVGLMLPYYARMPQAPLGADTAMCTTSLIPRANTTLPHTHTPSPVSRANTHTYHRLTSNPNTSLTNPPARHPTTEPTENHTLKNTKHQIGCYTILTNPLSSVVNRAGKFALDLGAMQLL